MIRIIISILLATLWSVFLLAYPTENPDKQTMVRMNSDANTSSSCTTNNYCAASGRNTLNEHIAEVEINGVTNVSGNNGGYGFFNIPIDLQLNSTVNFTLTPGYGGAAYPEWWSIYIDYNQDGIFDTNELVYDAGAYTTAVSGSFVVPGSIPTGSTRVRIIMQWLASTFIPCVEYDYGEVEDYCVNIVNNQPPTPKPLLNTRVFLEGAFISPMDGMHNKLAQAGLIPTTDPYVNQYTLQDPSILNNGYVDWVWVEVRNPDFTLVASQAGLLRTDGYIVSIDELPLDFGINAGTYHIFVRHRSHLPVMSPSPISLADGVNTVLLSAANGYTGTGSGQKGIQSGVWVMFAGDCSVDPAGYEVNGQDKVLWSADNGKFLDYITTDIDLDGDVNGFDRILLESNFGVFSGVPNQ